MNKYATLLLSLQSTGEGSMKCYGSSMLPLIKNPSICFYVKTDIYKVGDIVFCKVKGRYIDAHKITKIRKNGDTTEYMISNNHGYDNGWTKTVYGKVIKSVDNNQNVTEHN